MIAIRPVAGALAAALLCACAAPRPETTAGSGANGTPRLAGIPAAAAAAAAAPPGPSNALVPAPGKPGAIPLAPEQRAALDRALAALPSTERSRLRYALPSGDDGKARVVVYDGGGLPSSGRSAGRAHDYVVFPVLNGARGEHYDPEQNTLIAPIPPPPQREAQ